MAKINSITSIDNKKNIAILDTSSVSFMQGLQQKGVALDCVLQDYDLILIPEWVLTEIKDSAMQGLYLRVIAGNTYIVSVLCL